MTELTVQPARVVVMVWDGMRPDLISAELTPNLYALTQQGSAYRRATGVLPSVTRPTTSSVSTGVSPATHGITANLLVGPPNDRAPLDTGDHLALERLRAVNNGRILPVQTLAEAVVAAGKRIVLMGSGSTGQLALLDPEGVATRIHVEFTDPPAVADTLAARFGPAPTKAIPVNAANDWLNRVFTDYVLPELQPDIVIMWQCEPDASQHAQGLGSAAAIAAIQGNDQRLGQAVAAIEASGVPTTLIVASDHGHTTVNGMIATEEALTLGGFGEALASGQLHVGEQSIVIEAGPDAAALSALVGDWLVAQPWIAAVVSWGDSPPPAGALTPQALYGEQCCPHWPHRPTFTFSYAWTDVENEHGVPGTAYTRYAERLADLTQLQGPVVGLNRLTSTHGTLSPRDQNTVLVLSGVGIRQGTPDLPAGVLDIAPTTLALLGLPPLPAAEGRILSEALCDGPDPETVGVTTDEIAQLAQGPLLRHRVGKAVYLDSGVGC